MCVRCVAWLHEQAQFFLIIFITHTHPTTDTPPSVVVYARCVEGIAAGLLVVPGIRLSDEAVALSAGDGSTTEIDLEAVVNDPDYLAHAADIAVCQVFYFFFIFYFFPPLSGLCC